MPKPLIHAEDTAWKDILDTYLPDFLQLCLPDLYALVNWKKPWVSLDKELQMLSPESATGKRLVDKLVQVFLKDGGEYWVLIHVEIQGSSPSPQDFPERMFYYATRLYTHYRRPLASCAILTDANKDFRPSLYSVELGGSKLSLDYLVVKLIDYHGQQADLETSRNPFASVILIQLAALQAKPLHPKEQFAIKFRLTKRLFDQGFSKKEITALYLFIDWLFHLPAELALTYKESVYALEEATKMPYISSIEQMGIEKGVQQGEATVLLRLLTLKFGDHLPMDSRQRLEQASSKQLLQWTERILDAKTLEEVFTH